MEPEQRRRLDCIVISPLFVYVEAQHQIGGRVRTESIGDGFVFDYGAQWIHGKEGNSIYEFARERGLLSNDPSFEGEGR